MTRKGITVKNDYGAESPLWRAGDGWNGTTGPIPLDELPLSNELKQKLQAIQTRTDNYFKVMEKIPGGGWSHHTNEEFEKARLELGLSQFPDAAIIDVEKSDILAVLRKELPVNEFDII